MKKFYVLIVVLVFSAAQAFSQTFTWTGSAGDGEWATDGNWSGGTAPDGNTQDIIFNTDADVELQNDVFVRSLTVTGSHNVRIKGATGGETLLIESGDVTAPSVVVGTGNTLRFFQLVILLADNILGTINGTLTLEGTTSDNSGLILFPETTGQPAEFTINGTLNDEYGSGIVVNIDDYLNFSSGSTYRLSGPAPTIVKADYDPGSTIIINGTVSNNVIFSEVDAIGSVVYNAASQSTGLSLDLRPGLLVAGGLTVQNTNGQTLTLISNREVETNQTDYSISVNGTVNISGNSVVALATSNDNANTYGATFNGNFTMSGNSFSLQNTNGVSLPTTLFVKGNISHTAGDITALSNATASSVSLFNIEMNGGSAQQITSTPQKFNNSSNQVTLVLNNPAGVTLNSPLEVGMVGFKSNRKLITSDANFLTITNPSTASYVVSGSGFVDGPVRRITNTATEYIFPTGAGSSAQYVSVFPAAATSTTYQASFTNASPVNATVTSPLTDIVNYYWEVDRIGSGANAAVEITVPGAVSGANSSDALVVAKSSGGSDWVSARNASTNSFLPGDATSGKLRSEVQTSFSSFTIGWGPMDAVLPINLLSFTVNKSGAKANLNWKVTGNSTPASFDIMKSSDGINFSKIGTVQGLQAKLSYDFTDNNLVQGNNYYRLKMFDIDGTVSYSNIIIAINGTSGTMISSMMPTMVVDRARLNISSASKGNMQLVITDINGRIVQTQNTSINTGSQDIWINATRLATGYFQITGYMKGEKTATVRFFKR